MASESGTAKKIIYKGSGGGGDSNKNEISIGLFVSVDCTTT